MSDEGIVEVEARGRACVVALRRERKLNALSTALEGALAEALERPEVRSSACRTSPRVIRRSPRSR